MLLHSVSGLVQIITMAAAFSKEHGLSVGGTVPPATVAISGDSFTLGAITSIGSSTLEVGCAHYFSFPKVQWHTSFYRRIHFSLG